MSSCNFDGLDVTLERSLSDPASPGFGLVVIGNHVFVSTWFNARILSTFIETSTTSWNEELHLLDSQELFSLASDAVLLQPSSKYVVLSIL